MKARKNIFLILFTIILCVGCDQITKDIVKSHLPGTKRWTFAGGMLSLDYVENKGGVFALE
jgi:lipoprotein signal peptidase